MQRENTAPNRAIIVSDANRIVDGDVSPPAPPTPPPPPTPPLRYSRFNCPAQKSATPSRHASYHEELEGRVSRLESFVQQREESYHAPTSPIPLRQPPERAQPRRKLKVKYKIMNTLLKPFGCNNRRGAI